MSQPSLQGLKINIKGIVQGVGFRPFVFDHATRNNLTGWVRNTSGGVEIVVNGTPEQIRALITALHNHPPPLARIDSIETKPHPIETYPSFSIIASESQADEFLPVSPDVAICEDCKDRKSVV